MIPNPSIEVQTSSVHRPSVPAWLAEVVILSQHLTAKGVLEAFAHQVRLVRGRFGSYEPLDFLVLLIGSAVSGERTLSDFFQRLAPFDAAFMALFGRAELPHRSSLSRFLASVDRTCLEAFRTLFEQPSFAGGGRTIPSVVSGIGRGTAPSSLMWMPHARQHGSERCPVIPLCLPLAADLMRSVR